MREHGLAQEHGKRQPWGSDIWTRIWRMSKNYSKEILMWKEPGYQKIRKCLDNDMGPITFSRQDHGYFQTWALVATGIQLPSDSISREKSHRTNPRTERHRGEMPGQKSSGWILRLWLWDRANKPTPHTALRRKACFCCALLLSLPANSFPALCTACQGNHACPA